MKIKRIIILLALIFNNNTISIKAQQLIKQTPKLDSLESAISPNYKPKPITGRVEQIINNNNLNSIFAILPKADKSTYLKQCIQAYPKFFYGHWAGVLTLTSLYPAKASVVAIYNTNMSKTGQFIADNLKIGTKANVNFNFNYNKHNQLHLKPPQLLIRLPISDDTNAIDAYKGTKFLDIKQIFNSAYSEDSTNLIIDRQLIRNYILNLGNLRIEQDMLVLAKSTQNNNKPDFGYSETMFQFDIESNNVIRVTCVVLSYNNSKLCSSRMIYSGKIYRGYTATFNGISNVTMSPQKRNYKYYNENNNYNLNKEPVNDNDDDDE